MKPQAQAFAALFCGREDAYGTGKGPKGDLTGRVIREPLTLVQYGAHLIGHGPGLGVFPMLDGDRVWFGAIDLDEDDPEFMRALQDFIPGASWLERTTNGGWHLWVFFAEPAPAWAVRGLLKAALEAHGRDDVEVFPKQDTLREGMLGNYINLPYYGGTRPILNCPPGDPEPTMGGYAIEFFLDKAHAQRHQADSWVRRAGALGLTSPENRPEGARFGEREQLHRCAEYIYEHRRERPLAPGHRHAVLYSLSKMLLNWRAIRPETARTMVHEVNEAGTQPAPAGEVDRIFDTVIAGRYTSTSCDDPLVRPYTHPDCPIAHG